MRLSPADIEACQQVAQAADATARQITREVARRCGLRMADIMGPQTTAKIARARQIVMLACHAAGLTTTEIGKFLSRDHSTVIHGIRAEKARRDDG